MPKTRPAATDGVLYPPPRCLAFHTNGGPTVGQSFSKPVSREHAVRSWPCHCGQSNGRGAKELFSSATTIGAQKRSERHQAQGFNMQDSCKSGSVIPQQAGRLGGWGKPSESPSRDREQPVSTVQIECN